MTTDEKVAAIQSAVVLMLSYLEARAHRDGLDGMAESLQKHFDALTPRTALRESHRRIEMEKAAR